MIYYKDFLNDLSENSVLLIDTCCVLHDDFAGFLEALEECEQSQYRVLIPLDVYMETAKLSVTGKSETKDKAIMGLALLHRGFANNTLQLMKEYAVCTWFADPSIIGATLSLSTNSDVIVLTQDCQLSRDIRTISDSEAVRGGEIDVFKFASRGGGVHRFTDFNQVEKLTPQETTIQLLIKDGVVSQVSYARMGRN